MWCEFVSDKDIYKMDDIVVEYNHIGQAIQFNDNGTGYFITLFFEDEGDEPIEVIGGEDYGRFTYTATADGRINLEFGSNMRYSDYYKTFTLKYDGSFITMANNESNFNLWYSPKNITDMINHWDSVANGIDYNINNKIFRRNTWRNQDYIYIYDNEGKDTDKMGRAGYKKEMLPWYDTLSQTNLPNGFCNDITPENGWELAINLCGDINHPNNNFFGLYNKYTGILRFFYFMPNTFSSGNDHNWEITVTDIIAQHSLWRYGLTSDKIIPNKYKELIDQTSKDVFKVIVTPWHSLTSDGIIKPNGGWWAFDLDLSLYRPEADFSSSDSIKLQMNSWDTQHESLTRLIIGTSNYDRIEKSVSANSANGLNVNANDIFDFGEDVFDAAGDLIEFLLEEVTNGKAGEIIQTVGSSFPYVNFAFAIAKGAFSLYQEIKEDQDTTIDGNIIFGLTDVIPIQKVIQKSTVNSNIKTPTFSMDEMKTFYPVHGVWNLETPPIVYRSKIYFSQLLKKDHWYTFEDRFVINPYFFDPSSIKVQLNPKVFPEDQIEWMEIDSLCRANFTMQSDYYDQFRFVYGLNSRKTNVSFNIDKSDKIFNYTDPLFDFLYEFGNDMDMMSGYQEDLVKSKKILKGRGKGKLWIEPVLLNDKKEEKPLIPLLEVNVNIRFKMKNSNRIFIYNRNYLPEYKFYNPYEFFESKNNRKPYIRNTELYNYQIKRISDICSSYNLGLFNPGRKYMKPIKGTGDSERTGYYFLVDGNPKTKWSTNEMEDGVYFVEFKTLKPIIPKSYRLTTSYDIKNNPERLPKDWKLMAKLNDDDEWTTIDTITNDTSLPNENTNTIVYDLNITTSQYVYFRFEVSKINKNSKSKENNVELGYIEFDE